MGLPLIFTACGDGVGRPPPGDSLSGGDDDDAAPRWTGTAEVRVVDPAGVPVADAHVMLGGATAEDWSVTGADGRTTVAVADDGVPDRWLLAGKEGFISGGADLDDESGPAGVVEIVVWPLPDPGDDNPDYAIQPGGDGHSPDATLCGHCHPSIGDQWSVSTHAGAASNGKLWDVYVGGVLVDPEACDALGGWIDMGQQPGVEGGTLPRCYLGADAGRRDRPRQQQSRGARSPGATWETACSRFFTMAVASRASRCATTPPWRPR